MRPSKRSTVFSAASVVATWGTFMGLFASPAFAGATSTSSDNCVQVSYDAANPVSYTSKISLGVNTAAWDGNFLDSQIPSLLKQAGLGLVRYPGGSYADYYDWETNTNVQTGQKQSMDFDQFMKVLDQVGAAGVVTVDYGSGTPQQAADWVAYARQHHDNVPFWEIGNETYGSWEVDQYDPNDSSPDPNIYAQHALEYISAMRKADSTIQIGVPITTDESSSWNRTVLQQDGKDINFLDVHWYPYWTTTMTPSELLQSDRQIPQLMNDYQSLIKQYDPKAYVMVTEGNISSAANQYNEQPVGALFAASTALNWLSVGAKTFDWWDAHNYGSESADFGLFSSGTGGEPSAETPFPPYYGLELASLLTHPHHALTKLDTTDSNVEAFASVGANGVSLMIINDDMQSAKTIQLDVHDIAKRVAATKYSYSVDSPDIAKSSSTIQPTSDHHIQETVAPLSITVWTVSRDN